MLPVGESGSLHPVESKSLRSGLDYLAYYTSFNLIELVQLYRHFPKREDWVQGDLKAMYYQIRGATRFPLKWLTGQHQDLTPEERAEVKSTLIALDLPTDPEWWLRASWPLCTPPRTSAPAVEVHGADAHFEQVRDLGLFE
jgi:hypothetical protein